MTTNSDPASAPAVPPEEDISMFTPPEVRDQVDRERSQTPKAAEETNNEAEDADDEAEDDGGEADDGGSEADNGGSEAGEKPSRRQKRIDRLVKDMRAWEKEALIARQRLAATEAELESLRRTGTAPSAPAPQDLTPPSGGDSLATAQAPDPAAYRYGALDPQYISALTEYQVNQKVSALLQAQEQDRQRSAAEREAAQDRETVAKVIEAGRTRFPDFHDVVVTGAEAGDFALTRESFRLIAETEAAAEILYHLASHPEESVRVAEMSPEQLGRWVGRMEARFERPKATKPAPRRVSNAPEPINSARGSAGQFTTPAATSDFSAFERMANGKG